MLDQVIRAVEFLFGFTLAAGLVVLFAAVTATREERAREFAVMRAVGARASLLRQVQRAELAGVGLLAGFLASVVAVGVGWGLARYVFDFSWTASPWCRSSAPRRRGAGAGGRLVGPARGAARPVVETLRRAATPEAHRSSRKTAEKASPRHAVIRPANARSASCIWKTRSSITNWP